MNACSVEYVKESGDLRILSRDESTPRRVSVLQDMHFRNVLQRAILHRRTEEIARHLVKLFSYLLVKNIRSSSPIRKCPLFTDISGSNHDDDVT